MGREQKLNEKQLKFVEAYLDSMNITQAVLAAGYNMTPGAAAVHGTRLLKNAKIQKALREAREARQSRMTVNAAWVLEQIARIAQDEETAPRDQLKALELLAKHFGLLEKKQDETEGIRATFDDEMEAISG